MKLVRQPIPSSLCGQACVATLAGITLEEAIMVFRSKGCTSRKKVAQALLQLGIRSTNKLKRGFPECKTAIMKYTHPDGGSHWVIWHKKKYYDPVAGTFCREPKYLSDSRVTSHMEIYL